MSCTIDQWVDMPDLVPDIWEYEKPLIGLNPMFRLGVQWRIWQLEKEHRGTTWRLMQINQRCVPSYFEFVSNTGIRVPCPPDLIGIPW